MGEFLPYRDSMMGRPWTVNGPTNSISSLTTTGIPLAGPYVSSMMDYRESEGHQNMLRQQDAAFNSPTGLNSHREMHFGIPVVTPFKTIDTLKGYDVLVEILQRNELEARIRENRRQKIIDDNNEAFRARQDEKVRIRHSVAMTPLVLSDNPPYINQDRKGNHFGNGFGIQPIKTDNGVLPNGGMHDSFRVNASGNIFDAHTTIELKGGKKRRLDW